MMTVGSGQQPERTTIRVFLLLLLGIILLLLLLLLLLARFWLFAALCSES
jgi:hypothetical protein